jgi:OFA family oxalate/formate antiporter-like MFS transporter
MQSVTFFLFPFIVTSFPVLLVAAVILGLGIGASLALYPVLTSECFGVEHLGANYGLVFSAYGFGAIAIQGGAYLRDISGSYTISLLLAGVLTLVSVVIVNRIRLSYKLG